VRVEVIEMREGKIRLGLEGGPRPEPRAPRAERPERPREAGARASSPHAGHGPGAGRPDRPRREGGGERGDRAGRGDRDRGERPRRDSGGRGRDERTNIVASTVSANEPTTMALALRKAMEEAKRKAEGGAGK
jgi:hypothetical protein